MKEFISTPIYYVNDKPHIGHAYTTIIADMLKKYKWLNGSDVFLLTGTDEHGQKIEQSAKSKNKTPQAYTDEISAIFRVLWNELEIDYDYFIRTTDTYHKEAVVAVFEKLCANGDVYLGEYEGDYCVSCESFFVNVANGICPDCAGNKPLTKIKEESYFFALSKYQQKLLDWYHSSDNVILPAYRKNEVIRFVEGGLQDLSISRTSFEWGITLPPLATNQNTSTSRKKHIAYVWLDALFNYLSALGFFNTKMQDRKSYWENATHIVGKDILRLRVDDAGDGINFDHANWADAVFTYVGEKPLPGTPWVGKKVILTPKPGPKPRINGPKVFGVRPGSPFLFTIPATGNQPISFFSKPARHGLEGLAEP